MTFRAFLSVAFFFIFSSSLLGKELMATFDYKNFYSPQTGNYVETYLNIIGYSAEYKANEKGNLQAKIQITQIFKQNDKVVTFKKYNLSGPESMDSVAEDLIDQKRFGELSPGYYDFFLELKDLNSDNPEPFTFEQQIKVEEVKGKIKISDIELVMSAVETKEVNELSKSGYDIIPLVNNYYPIDFEKIAFYFEIYKANISVGQNEKYLLKQYIEEYEHPGIMSKYLKVKRISAKEVSPVLNTFGISELATGNYNLVIELRDRENKLLTSKKIFFQRSNPLATLNIQEIASVDVKGTFVKTYSEDTLDFFIHSLRPIAGEVERDVIDKEVIEATLDFKQKFFYTFWKNRNLANPEYEWAQYRKKVNYVQKYYKTRIKEGFETDRGRIYCKYGAPNDKIQRPNEPSSYPYEIWRYYKVGIYSNKRFIFYMPDLVGNDYELLHSDLQGEVNNKNWQLILNKRNTPFQDIDQETGNSHFGGNSGTYIEQMK